MPVTKEIKAIKDSYFTQTGVNNNNITYGSANSGNLIITNFSQDTTVSINSTGMTVAPVPNATNTTITRNEFFVNSTNQHLAFMAKDLTIRRGFVGFRNSS